MIDYQLRGALQTMSPSQLLMVHSVITFAFAVKWSCSDAYSMLQEGCEDAVLRQLFRVLDRTHEYDWRDLAKQAHDSVQQWIQSGPESPSIATIRELVTALSPDDRRRLLHLLTEEECLSPMAGNGFTISPFFDEDAIEWAGYTIHVYSNNERYQLDHNPGKFDDIELLIQVLRQVVPSGSPQLQGGGEESINDIAADLRDRLEPWQLINIKNSLTNGPTEFFWSGDGVPVELRKVQALQWELRVGGYSHDRVTWILDGREVCQLAGEIVKYF